MKLYIGENIRKFRKQTDMTQEQLADRLGVTYQSVSRWENGTTYPDMELIPAITELFSVTADALLGIPEVEKEKKAAETIEALCRETMKEEIHPEAVVPLIRDIRNNYLSSSNAWRLWVSSNNRCYRHPDVLPEVRLMADAYRELSPFSENISWIQTMASVEDEDHLDEFFKNYTTPYDLSERALRFERYFELKDSERFEPERRARFYLEINRLLDTRTLHGWSNNDSEKQRATVFQSDMLNLIRDRGSEDELDVWTMNRLYLGFNNAVWLAAAGDKNGIIALIEKGVCLLEKAMEITEKRTLGCSCSWLDGMVCDAEEYWTNSNSNPDEEEERTIRFIVQIGQTGFSKIIYPSFHYNMLVSFGARSSLCDNPEFMALTERVKALIKTRPQQKQ